MASPTAPAAARACQLYMRKFRDGQIITIEPFRADSFPVERDLVVNRGAYDRIMQAGGFISERAGSAPDANSGPVPRLRRRRRSGCRWRASAAAPARQPARTDRQCYS